MEQSHESPSKSNTEAQQEEPLPAEPTAEELLDHEEDENDQVPVNEEDLQGADLSEMGTWILQTLQQQQPDAEITLGSVQALTDMLDGITSRILEEASRISQGEGPSAPSAADADEHAAGAEAVPSAAPNHTSQALTSQDIHKALKRLLPGEPGDPLRPYLPAVTKQAWHLDKQSLKGIKRKKGNTGVAVAAVKNPTANTSNAAAGNDSAIASLPVQENIPPSISSLQDTN